MASNDAIEAKKAMDDIVESFRQHNTVVAEGAVMLEKYSTVLTKLPSETREMLNMFSALLTETKKQETAIGTATKAAVKHEETIRTELQKTLDAERNAASKKKAQMNQAFADAEAIRKKDIASQQGKLAEEIALYEKEYKQRIEANNKKVQSDQARAAKEIEIETKKNNSIAEATARQEAKWRRTGSNSAIPGMGIKIADDKRAAAGANALFLANEKLSSAYTELNARRTEAKNKLRDLVASEKASNAEIRIAQREFDTLDKKVRQADRAVGDMSKNVGNYKSALSGVNNLMGAFGIATGLYLAVDIGRNIFETTKQLQSLDLALKNVSGSQETFKNNQIFISDIAGRYGIEIKSLTKNYTDFLAASKGIISQKEIEGIFTSVSKSAAAMGLSVESTDGAFLALEQMMSKGTVQAEELKKQLGNALPGAMRAAAMAYMELHPAIKTVQQAEAALMADMKKGAIDSATYIPLIVKNLEKLYGIETLTSIDTLQGNLNRLSNTWVAMVRHMNESDTNGLSVFFSTLLRYLDNSLKGVDKLTMSFKQMINDAKGKGQSEEKSLWSLGDVKKLDQKQLDEVIADYVYKIKKAQEEITKLNESGKDKNGKGVYMDVISLYFRNKDYEKWFKYLGNAEAGIKAIRQYQKEIKDLQASPPPKVDHETDAQKIKKLKEEKKAREELAKAIENELELRYKLSQSNLDRYLNLNNQKLDNENLYFEERLAIIEQNYKIELQKAAETYLEDIRLHKDSKNQMLIDANNYRNKIDEIDKAHTDLSLKELDRYYKAFEEYHEKYDKEAPANDLTQSANFEGGGIKLDLFGEDPKKTFEDWQKGAKGATDATEELKKATQDWIDGFKDEFISNSGFTTFFDIMEEKIVGFGDNWKTTLLGVTEVMQEFYNFFAEASMAGFENEKNNLKEQRDLSLSYAGDSATGRAEIERQYEKEQKAIRKREAKAKKEMAMFNIILDTAQAVVAALPNVALSIAIGIMGALQLAMVSAKDIPQYWKGTNNAEEGLAWTQERGREIILDNNKNLKSVGSDKGATLTKMDKGDKVLTHAESMKYFEEQHSNLLGINNISPFSATLHNPLLGTSTLNITTSGMSDEQVDRIVSSIESKAEFKQFISNGELKTVIKKGNTETEAHNRRINGIGTSV